MRMTIVGRNPRAGGSECVVFGALNERGAFAAVTPGLRSPGLQAFGGWEQRAMRYGAGAAVAPAWVGWTEGGDFCRGRGRLVLVSHRWSGVLQINDIGRKYVVDLYSEATRLILLDAVNAIMVDVTALAEADGTGFRLPALTPTTIVAHIVAERPWFRFLEPDPGFNPGRWRRMIEALRRPPDALKLRLIAALLPLVVAARPSSPAPAELGLRDELKLIAAAVEGLALRVPA